MSNIYCTYVLRELDGSGEHLVRGTVLLSTFVGLEELHEAVAEILDLRYRKKPLRYVVII